MIRSSSYCLLLCLSLFIWRPETSALYAQESAYGIPYDIGEIESKSLETIKLPPIDNASLIREDALNRENRTLRPDRFGKEVKVGYGLHNSGSWREIPTGRLWHLKISSPGAYSLPMAFSEYYLPEGAYLYIFNPDKSDIKGAYTASNNTPDRLFSTEGVKGDVAILQYFEPYNAKEKGQLVLSSIIHAYKDAFGANTGIGEASKSSSSSSSASCNVNAVCSSAFSTEMRSVVRISTGNDTCSGALINNTASNHKPYILTASHCVTASGIWAYSQWLIRFAYESSTCGGSSSGDYYTHRGVTLKANDPDSDFALLELNTTPPAAADLVWAGWDRSSSGATSGSIIHHPEGDIKKISTFNTTLALAQFTTFGPINFWNHSSWATGTLGFGSSGGPWFNSSGRIIGQHTGTTDATPACPGTALDGFAGAFHLSWDMVGTTNATQLKPWLDPLGTNPTTSNSISVYIAPVTNLTITNAQVWDEFPELSWTGSSTSGVTYKIYRRPSYGAFSLIGSTTSTTFTDTDILIDDPYYVDSEEWVYYVEAQKDISGYTFRSKRSNTVTEWGIELYKKPEDRGATMPQQLELLGSYPNPFNPDTNIRFRIKEASHTTLGIYNSYGQLVDIILDEGLQAGEQIVRWTPSGNLPSGTYYYRIRVGNSMRVDKVILLK